MGLAMIGGAGGVSSALEAVQNGRADTVIALEKDLYRRADAATAEGLLSARHVIVIDHVAHATASRAEIALPAATFAEGEGTLVNQEGRAAFKSSRRAARSGLALAARHRRGERAGRVGLAERGRAPAVAVRLARYFPAHARGSRPAAQFPGPR